MEDFQKKVNQIFGPTLYKYYNGPINNVIGSKINEKEPDKEKNKTKNKEEEERV